MFLSEEILNFGLYIGCKDKKSLNWLYNLVHWPAVLYWDFLRFYYRCRRLKEEQTQAWQAPKCDNWYRRYLWSAYLCQVTRHLHQTQTHIFPSNFGQDASKFSRTYSFREITHLPQCGAFFTLYGVYKNATFLNKLSLMSKLRPYWDRKEIIKHKKRLKQNSRIFRI